MPNLNLDYEASVPGTEPESRLPVSVSSPDMPLSMRSPRDQDYIPNPNAETPRRTTPKRSSEGPRSAVRRIRLMGRDYIGHKETEKRSAHHTSRIQELAKTIYGKHKKVRADYKSAQEMVSASSQEELANPDESLARAMRIVVRGNPMSKKKAIAEARADIESKIVTQ